MARTHSTMLPLGTEAPDFSLPDPRGGTVSLGDIRTDKGFLVMILCNHCPFVKHVRGELAKVGADFQKKGLGVVAISPNDADAYPQDGPEAMAREADEAGYTFPYLFDESQEVAKAYEAACTPEFYLFDGAGKLVYRGQLDWSRPANDIPVTGEDLRQAAEALLAGREIPDDQVPALGCNIKWKPGNAPVYFGG